MMSALSLFSSGMITAGYLAAFLFFLKFWRRSGESLFRYLALAFVLMAANQAAVALADVPREEVSWLYLLRLAAFTIIAVAIIAKNTRKRGER